MMRELSIEKILRIRRARRLDPEKDRSLLAERFGVSSQRITYALSLTASEIGRMRAKATRRAG